MSSFFYELYVFNTRNKKLFTSCLIVLVILLAGLSYRLEFHENIADVFPKNEELNQIDTLLNNSGLNSNLIIHIYSTDSSTIDADSIIAISQKIDQKLTQNYSAFISQSLLTYPDSLVNQFYQFFTNYLPLYLTDNDYKIIAEKLTQEGIENTITSNYKSIISPLGIVSRKMIMTDPFGLVRLPLKNFQNAQFDPNFQLYNNHLFSRDKKHLLYFLELSNRANETSKNGKLIAGLNEIIDSVETDILKVDYYGAPAVAVANASRIKTDVTISVSLAVIIILLLIILYFQNIAIFLLVLLPGIFGTLVGLAILASLGKPISLISLGVGSIMVGITVDFALHLFAHYREEESTEKVFKSITEPTLMSSFTTATAFFSLVLINSNALKDLGLFVGVGVVSASLFTLIVLPHFISDRIKEKGNRFLFFENFLKKVVSKQLYKKKWALALFLSVSVISLVYWNSISFNKDLMSLNYMPDYLKQSETRLNDISSLSGQKLYLLTSGNDFWEALEKNEQVILALSDLQNKNLIKDFKTINGLIPDNQLQKVRLSQWNSFWSEIDTASIQQYINAKTTTLGFKKNAFSSLNTYFNKAYTTIGDDDLERILNVAGNRYVVHSANNTSIITIVNYNSEQKHILLDELENISETQILDRNHLTEKLLEVLSVEFKTLINTSLIVVFGILLLIYGRIELALISIAPIAIGWIWTLGLMGLFNLTFNIVNIIICSLIFGLGIDYSIFNLRSLNFKYAYGEDNKIPFRISILLSAVTTLIGIGVLIFAEHPALKSIALLAIIGITSVLFLTFFVEEALYDFFIQKRKDKGFIPFTFSSFFISVTAFSIFLVGCILLMFIRLIFFIKLFHKRQKAIFHYLIMLYCRFIVYVMMNMHKEIVGKHLIDFNNPSIIISHHHSFLDILIILMFNPKVVMVTNDWVYNSPFFGIVVRYADFILSTKGVDYQLEKIQNLVDEGYSIIIFPEGTRSETIDCGRFHKGAFYLAEKLQLDIQPVVLHGTHHTLPKKDGFYLRNGYLYIEFLDRISIKDTSFGTGYRERTKLISKHYKKEYLRIRKEQETPKYFLNTLIKNFIFKGPILEWYLKVKLNLENNYELFHNLLPQKGKIVDVGCGYGFLPYSLTFNNIERDVTGIDYDENKIKIAKNCPVIPDNLSFENADALSYNYSKSDVFILSDVLHYLTVQEQNELMKKLIDNLEQGGMIMVRDGDKSKKLRHKGTIFTEIFSTNTGFNKTRNNLNYISENWLKKIANENQLEFESIDNTKLTSNIISILKKS